MADKTETYSLLAKMYDDVMRDVDYEAWADYVDDIIQKHNPDALSIMELATGTGAISLSLDELDCYDLSASDKSPEMIEIARQKAEDLLAEVQFEVIDFLNINSNKHYDVIIILFDSVNYLRTRKEMLRMFQQIKKLMKPHSLLIFDFTTPNYSPKVEKSLNEVRRTKFWNYERISSYSKANKTHLNRFTIELLNDEGEIIEKRVEDHLQRAWKLSEMRDIIIRSDLTILAQYPDFEFTDADETSDRITMVVQCPQTR